MTEKRLETKVLHSGYAGEPQFGARAVPIYETASFLFGTAEEAARRFSEHDINKIYTRIGNPTVAVLRKDLPIWMRGWLLYAMHPEWEL